MRPEEIALLNTSDNILLGGIPGAEQKKKLEHYTKNIYTVLKVEQASSISRIYKILPSVILLEGC